MKKNRRRPNNSSMKAQRDLLHLFRELGKETEIVQTV